MREIGKIDGRLSHVNTHNDIRDARAFFVGAVFLASLLAGCSSVPASLDPATYLFYERQVHSQQAELKLPLIGMYSLLFSGEGLIEVPEKAKVVKGDFKFAAIKRGSDIDFVSMSGFAGFGGLSDQGGSYSVNLQGAAFWTFPLKSIEASNKVLVGSSNGLLNGKKGKATLESIEGGWFRVRIIFDRKQDSSGNSPVGETYFLRMLF